MPNKRWTLQKAIQVLAVTIINQGFSDISGVKGYFDFPSGFKALVTPDNVDSDTAISTYNGVVKAGQSFVLYFPVSILQNTHVGKEYQGQLKIKYFKLTEQTKKDFRTANIEIPFRLSGKVILEVQGSNQNSVAPNSNGQPPLYPFGRSDIINAVAGTPNTLKIDLSNLGSASATGVIVNVLNNNQQITNGNQAVGVSNSSTSSGITTTQVPYVNLGPTVFNIGTISPNQKFGIDPIIFPPVSSGNVIQNLEIRISYNDAYGNKKIIDHLLGIQVVPTSPQNDIFVSPASSFEKNAIQNSPQFISGQSYYYRNNQGSKYMEISDIFPFRAHPITTLLSPETPSTAENPTVQESEKQIEIVAGKIENISFSLNSFGESGQIGDGTLSNIAVTLIPQSPSVKILGNSIWNIPDVGNAPNVLTTKVFASPSLIGNPVFFTVNVQYLKNYQELKTANFNLGAIVTGNIKLDVNDLTLRPIGNSYNIVGNILNQGNTLAQFSKISIMDQQIPNTGKDNSSSSANNSASIGTETSEYIGDLPVNEPIPFNIPMSNSQMQGILDSENNPALQGNDPLNNSVIVPVKLTYTDSIQKVRQIILYKSLPINWNSLENSQGSAQNNNGFVNSYWASDAPLQSNSASTTNTFTKLSIQKAVGPGEGSSILAVELSNTGFSDITGVIGYLKLPPGFVADNSGTINLRSDLEQINSSTSVASSSDVIKSGQTYTLYFKVKVLSSATLGNHLGSLSLYYFKVPDTKIGTYRIQDIDIPFYIPGKAILDSTSNTTDLQPGINNPVKLIISNKGTAEATGVILQISESDETVISDSSRERVISNDTSINTLDQESASLPIINTGQSTFNIETIPVNGSAEVQINIMPSINSGESLQKINLHINYINSVGVPNSVDKNIGFRVLPNPPDGGLSISTTASGAPAPLTPSNPSVEDEQLEEGLSVSPSVTQAPEIESRSGGKTFMNAFGPKSGYLDIDIKGTSDIPNSLEFISTENSNPRTNLSQSEPNLGNLPTTDNDTVFLTAGKIDDFKFNITNNNNNPIRNAVITLTANSGALEILGNSKWNIDAINPKTTLQFPTKVFASKTLINSPISFKVDIEYVSNGQLKSDSFFIGANVVGEIEISVNELSVDNIGGTLNVVGNLLNKGNTGGLFTTVELVTDKDIIEREIQNLSTSGQNVSNLKIVTPASTTPEYPGGFRRRFPTTIQYSTVY